MGTPHMPADRPKSATGLIPANWRMRAHGQCLPTGGCWPTANVRQLADAGPRPMTATSGAPKLAAGRTCTPRIGHQPCMAALPWAAPA